MKNITIDQKTDHQPDSNAFSDEKHHYRSKKPTTTLISTHLVMKNITMDQKTDHQPDFNAFSDKKHHYKSKN